MLASLTGKRRKRESSEMSFDSLGNRLSPLIQCGQYIPCVVLPCPIRHWQIDDSSVTMRHLPISHPLFIVYRGSVHVPLFIHWFSTAVILKSCYMIINSLWIEINFKMQREITPIWEDQFASVGGYFNSQSVTIFKDCRCRREKGGIFKLKFVYNVYLNGHWKSVWPL